VMFDELMKRIPVQYSASFVSVAQGIQYLSSVLAPTIGTLLAGLIGINLALVAGGMVSILGFALFLMEGTRARIKAIAPEKE